MTGTRGSCKKAKLQAGIKPTALCSVTDKENSIESLLYLLHYIYNYYCGYAPCLPVTNFIWPYLHQIFIDSYGLNSYGKPLKRPFDEYQSCLEAVNNGRDIRQINW